MIDYNLADNQVRLFVRRVPDDATDTDLQEYFAQFGELAAVLRGPRS